MVECYIKSIYIIIIIIFIRRITIFFSVNYNDILYNIFFYNILSLFENILNTIKDFPKERYNTYAKSCNSNLYTKYPGATYSGLLLGTMRCL